MEYEKCRGGQIHTQGKVRAGFIAQELQEVQKNSDFLRFGNG